MYFYYNIKYIIKINGIPILNWLYSMSIIIPLVGLFDILINVIKGFHINNFFMVIFSMLMCMYWFVIQNLYNIVGTCPLQILGRSGFRFFRAARLVYEKDFNYAMCVYLPYTPLLIVYLILTFI